MGTLLAVGSLLVALRFTPETPPTSLDWAIATGGVAAIPAAQRRTAQDPARRGLGDPWPVVRARAVRGLSDIDDPKDVSRLWDMRRDPDTGVRMEVVLALTNDGQIGKAKDRLLNGPGSALAARMDAFLKRIGDGPPTEQEVAMIRAELQDFRSEVDAFIGFDLTGTVQGLGASDRDLLQRCLAYLTRCSRGGVEGDEWPFPICGNWQSWPYEKEGALMEFVKSHSEIVREALTRRQVSPALLAALAETGNPEWQGVLRQYLNSRDSNLQATAAEGLGVLGDQAAVPQLRRLIRSPKVGVALSSMTSLRLLLGDRASADFINYLSRVPDDDLREAFVYVEPTIGMLSAALSSPRVAVRIFVAETLRDRDGVPDSLRRRVLQDPDPEVRAAIGD